MCLEKHLLTCLVRLHRMKTCLTRQQCQVQDAIVPHFVGRSGSVVYLSDGISNHPTLPVPID